ncbi:MAG: PEP-CTERM sorting domain-containing protein [Planctomycetota bacterium]
MKTILGLLAVAGMAGSAFADDYTRTLTLQNSASISEYSGLGGRADAGASYSNVDNFTGFVSQNGGAAGGITRLQADDINFARPDLVGQAFRRVTFSVGNLNAEAVAARVRVRFWFGDGAGGGPGTYYNGVGFTFNPITFQANSANLFFFDPGAGVFAQIAAGQRMWAGMTFDNVGTATTDAQLNNLGQLIFNPAVIGGSADALFTTNGAGSFFGAANPAGTITNYGGNPVANLGWEFVVPAPTSLALLGLGGLVVGRRRR